jgi:hypothetical protein
MNKLSAFLTILIALAGSNSFADYFETEANHQANRRAQYESDQAAKQAAWHQRFEATLFGLANSFATKHRGISGSIQSVTGSRSTTGFGPNRALILDGAMYKFSTNDGSKCILSQQYYEDDNTGPNGHIQPAIHCFVNGKPVNKAVRVR